MRILASLLLCLFLIAAGGEQSSISASRESLEQILDRKEQELERLYSVYWEIQYRLEQGDASASDKAVERSIRGVMNDPVFLEQLKRSHFSDPVLQRRRDLFLEVAEDSQIATNAELAERVESIRKASSTKRYKIGVKLLDRPELDNVIAHNKDRKLRRDAWYAQAGLTRISGDQIRSVMKLRNQLGLQYAKQKFGDFMLARRSTNRGDLTKWYEQIRSESEEDYRALLSRVQQELHLDKVEPWDLQYYFSTLTPELENKFPFEGAWQRTTEVSSLLGFDFSRLPVQVKITDITFGGYTMPVWYGKEIKMLVSKHTGVLFADTILHESGHALHFSFVQEPTFILRDNYPPPMDEGLGQSMSLMLFRPEIATTVYGLSSEDAQALRERRRLETNYAMRALMVQSEFEVQAYDNPDQDLDGLYDRICSKYLAVACHHAAIWGYDPFLAAIPLYQQNYVLAEMFAYQVHHTLDQKFGRTWGHEAGTYLHDKFLRRGGTLTLDEIMREGTGEALTASYLIKALKPGSTSQQK